MKFCSTCTEEFADKFSFCPVDGTPLNAFVPEAAAEPVTKFVEEPVFSEPVASEPVTNRGTLSEPVRQFLRQPETAAYVPRGEFHLTMIDDEGLVGRLAKELSDVAHQYQLTWPEFKRDPFGFTKRSIVGYGQMLSKFFGNRNIVIAMVVAVVAMVAMVLIAGLLDRLQSVGTSRAGIVGFSVLAGAFLIGVFATWLRKNQNAAVLGALAEDSKNAMFGVIAAFAVMLLLVGGGVFLNFWSKRKRWRS